MREVPLTLTIVERGHADDSDAMDYRIDLVCEGKTRPIFVCTADSMTGAAVTFADTLGKALLMARRLFPEGVWPARGEGV